MSFMSKLKEAEGHLSQYESVASDMATTAAAGLETLQQHSAAVKSAIASAVALSEQFVSTIQAAATAASGTESEPGNQFLGKSN